MARYLDESGLSYLWSKITGRYDQALARVAQLVRFEAATDGTIGYVAICKLSPACGSAPTMTFTIEAREPETAVGTLRPDGLWSFPLMVESVRYIKQYELSPVSMVLKDSSGEVIQMSIPDGIGSISDIVASISEDDPTYRLATAMMDESITASNDADGTTYPVPAYVSDLSSVDKVWTTRSGEATGISLTGLSAVHQNTPYIDLTITLSQVIIGNVRFVVDGEDISDAYTAVTSSKYRFHIPAPINEWDHTFVVEITNMTDSTTMTVYVSMQAYIRVASASSSTTASNCGKAMQLLKNALLDYLHLDVAGVSRMADGEAADSRFTVPRLISPKELHDTIVAVVESMQQE